MAQEAPEPRLKFSSPWRGLTLQILVVSLLPLMGLLMVIIFGSLALHQNAMRALVGERDERAARMAAHYLQAQIDRRAQVVRSLAARASSVTSADQALAALGDPPDGFEGGLAVLGKDGTLQAALGERALWERRAAQLLPALRDWQARNPAFASQTFFYELPAEGMLIAAAPGPDGAWTVAGAFSVTSLFTQALGEVFSSDPHSTLLVVGQGGSLLYQSGPAPEGIPAQHAGVMEALQGESGTSYLPAAHGEHVVAYSPVTPPGWALVIEEPWEMVSTPTLRATQIAPLVLVPVLILAVLALWYGIRQVVQPLQALERSAAELAWGDFDAIEKPVGGIREIRRLQTGLVHLAHKVQAAQQGLRGYIGAMTAAQEDERRRLARELHDDTLQSLIALQQRVKLVQLDRRDDSGAQALQEVEALTGQAIQNLRRQTRALRPIYLEDLGLVPALEMLAREAAQAMDIPVSFESTGEQRRLEAAAELALYRMAQEALNNIARHAQAAHAGVSVRFTPQAVRLEIFDDGRGFEVPRSPAEFAPGGHFGLLGLHERAELTGARLSIQSTPGQGTRVQIDV